MYQIMRIIIVCFVVILVPHDTYAEDSKNITSLSNTLHKAAGITLKIVKVLLMENVPYLSQAYGIYQSLDDVIKDKTEYQVNGIEAQWKKINSQFNLISNKMDALKNDLVKKLDEHSDKILLQSQLNNFYTPIQHINAYYIENLMPLLNTSKTFRNDTIHRFINATLSQSNAGVNILLRTMHDKFLETQTSGKNIPSYFASAGLVDVLMCLRENSAQRLIFDMYEFILTTETKGLMMIIFANNILNDLGGHTDTSEISTAEENFVNRISNTMAAIEAIIATASCDVWKCDPKIHVEGKTYVTIGPLFQRYVMHESEAWSLDEIIRWNVTKNHQMCKMSACGCQKDCSYHSYVEKAHCHKNFCREVPERLRCSGKIHNCEKVHDDLYACPSETPNRRYRYLRTGDNEYFGHTQTCPMKNEVHAHSERFRIVNWCDYCVCTCESTDSDDQLINKHFSFLEETTDPDKIVTGVQIVVQKNVFRIQLQQAPLLPEGKIDYNNVTMGFSSRDHNLHKLKDSSLTYTLDWNNRAICLDEINVEEGHLITGLRFEPQLAEDSSKFCVKFSVQSTPFNFESGKLDTENSKWISNTVSSRDRAEITFDQSGDIPIFYQNNKPRTTSNLYFKFTTSDLRKDAGQNVIPFIDIQPVVLRTPAPITGVALSLKNEESSAGFLAFRVSTLDLTELMKKKKRIIEFRKNAH